MFRFTVPNHDSPEEFRKRLIDRVARVLNTTSEEASKLVAAIERPDKHNETKTNTTSTVDPHLEKKVLGSLAIAYYRRLANLLEVVCSGNTSMLDEDVEAFYLKVRSGFLTCMNNSDLCVVLGEFDEDGLPPSILELDPLVIDWELIMDPAIRHNKALLLRTAAATGVPYNDPYAELFVVSYDEKIETIRSYKRQGEKKLFARIEASVRSGDLQFETRPPGTSKLERPANRGQTQLTSEDSTQVDSKQNGEGPNAPLQAVSQSRREDMLTPMRVFLSYSHRDERLLDQLLAHLTLLQREHLIDKWHDRKIGAGTEWRQSIDANLRVSDLVLLLVSSSFIASDYCWDKEMTMAMEQHNSRQSRVIPIILKPCDWHSAPFGKLEALPTNGKPITRWSNRDLAWLDIVNGIRAAVFDLTSS